MGLRDPSSLLLAPGRWNGYRAFVPRGGSERGAESVQVQRPDSPFVGAGSGTPGAKGAIEAFGSVRNVRRCQGVVKSPRATPRARHMHEGQAGRSSPGGPRRLFCFGIRGRDSRNRVGRECGPPGCLSGQKGRFAGVKPWVGFPGKLSACGFRECR